MARYDKPDERGNLLRALIYGPPKSQKTYFAMRLAEAGYNVILADLDDGAAVGHRLSEAAKRRVFRLDMRPNSDSYGTSGAAALSYAMSGQTVYFDEEIRTYVPIQKIDPDREYLRIALNRATARDVLVLDTWTAFVHQLTMNSVNVFSALKVPKLEWDDYGAIRLILDHFLGGLTKLNCHSIVVAHSETYAKKKPDVDPKGKQIHEIISSVRLQPASVSRAHAETMAGKFTDVLYMENKGATLGVRISTKGTVDFDAGSRYLAGADYKFDDVNSTVIMRPEHNALVAGHGDFDSDAVVVVRGADVIAMRKDISGGTAAGGTVEVSAAPIIKRLNMSGVGVPKKS